MSFKINHQNEEQEAEDRLVQDPGKYEGTSLEHFVCNAFKEICLSGIEDKSHSLEWNTSNYDENTYSLNYDRNLVDTMIDNEITNVSQEVKNICEQNQVLQEKLDKDEKMNQEEYEKDT